MKISILYFILGYLVLAHVAFVVFSFIGSGSTVHPTNEELKYSENNCKQNPDLMGCGDIYYY